MGLGKYSAPLHQAGEVVGHLLVADGGHQEVCGCNLKQPGAKTTIFTAHISTKNWLQVKPSFSAVVSDPAFRRVSTQPRPKRDARGLEKPTFNVLAQPTADSEAG